MGLPEKLTPIKKPASYLGGLTNLNSKSWSDARAPSAVVVMDVAWHEVKF
jgi:hypothetical protein